MTILHKSEKIALFANKTAIREAVAEQNAIMGFVKDITATAIELRAMVLAYGVRPHENFLSQGIIGARNEA